MGEYGIFVWPCYIAVVVLLTGLCYQSWTVKRKAEAKLAELKDQLERLEDLEE